ncbi:hypothetical protein H072_7233 [Dactylellina haptotyla CBS 200.50]|uniref:Uncharacterized protein n=1 Tax=Dactylellina haptotyla (strain CBS 200.50) TaxID=1284197 RepID=S8A821_DACHA|nr:hypothetical protein H072_7233 [Dactylellina haptotyla CBS 200.50]
MNPHIFGSSRFTRETESETSLDCYYGRAEGCFDDIDRDLQSLETSMASGSSNASAEDWNIIQSSCYDESMDSQFASLAITQNTTSNAFNPRTSEPSSRNTSYPWL